MISSSRDTVRGGLLYRAGQHLVRSCEPCGDWVEEHHGKICVSGCQGYGRSDEVALSGIASPIRQARHSAFAIKCLGLAFTVLFFAISVGQAADVPEDVRAAAKEQRDAVVAKAKRQVTELEKQRVAASKRRDMSEVASLVQQIKQAKLEVSAATKKTVDDYAREMVDADAKSAATAPGRPKGGMPAQQPDDPADEAERLELSGGCPLKITGGNFFHAHAEAVRLGASAGMFPKDLFGPQTMVVCEVVNKAGEPIQAYEVLCQFLDGFDEVIAEKTFQGTLLAPGEIKKSINGVTPIETAVQMKIYLQKAKLADGTIWKRQPEHKRVGVLVKKLEGADLGVGK